MDTFKYYKNNATVIPYDENVKNNPILNLKKHETILDTFKIIVSVIDDDNVDDKKAREIIIEALKRTVALFL